MFKELHTQLDDVSECAHDNETDTDSTGDLNELALVRYGELASVHPLLPSIKVSMPCPPCSRRCFGCPEAEDGRENCARTYAWCSG